MQGAATQAMWLHRRGAATPQMPARRGVPDVEGSYTSISIDKRLFTCILDRFKTASAFRQDGNFYKQQIKPHPPKLSQSSLKSLYLCRLEFSESSARGGRSLGTDLAFLLGVTKHPPKRGIAAVGGGPANENKVR